MNPENLPSKQTGAVLLAFMLILITGTSYLLLNRLNDYSTYARDTATQIALLEAKKALLSYAMNYPELRSPTEKGPGFLPCPDNHILTDPLFGNPSSNCAVSTGTTLGRLPFKILGLKDLRESGGDLLWYAVSDNYKNTQANDTVINSETRGMLSVDASNDIVAVIIAPGSPLTGQNSRPGINKSDYLEDVNADSDASTFVTSSTGEMNDRLVTITRSELMAVVEQRVINEIRAVLTGYYNDYGAYPWMTAFADPKADSRRLAGTHSGSSGSSNLTDTSTDFTDWNIQNDDLVINVSDGSIANVTGVTANTLSLSGLTSGTDNDFDVNDKYVVFKKNWSSNIFYGTAESGSNGLTLVDTSKDFEKLGITAGDIIDIIDGGNVDSSGMVDKIDSSTQLTVSSLSGGTVTQFTSGTNYIIRSNMGRVTAGTSTSLTDTTKDFIVMGIQAGDLVANLTDDSIGTISAVTANTLTVNSLQFGTDNDFDVNDYYYLPRHNTDSNAREGLLSFHVEGELFPTAYDLEFNITAASGDIVFDTVNFPVYQAGYKTAIENYVSNYVNLNLLSLTLEEGKCRWIVPGIADCTTGFDNFVSISGRDTASVNSQTQITDSTAQFITDGVKRGDLAHNYDDETFVISGIADSGSSGTTLKDAGVNFSVYEPYNYVIQNDTLETELSEAKIQGVISSIIDADTLIATPYVGEGTAPIEFRPGDAYSIYAPRKDMVVTAVNSNTNVSISRLSATNPDFDAGEYYRIIPAASSTSGTVESTLPAPCTASAVCQITDTGVNFITAGVEVGDTIENTTSSPNASFGVITARDTNTVTMRLYGGTQNLFSTGDNFTIYHDYVHSRRHIIHTRFSGNMKSKSLTSAAGTATGGSNNLLLEDTAKDFINLGVLTGDTVTNTTDGSSGIIKSRTNTKITVDSLINGTNNVFTLNDNYTITGSNKRLRDVCINYDTDCNTASSSTLTGNSGIPLIDIQDFQSDGTTKAGQVSFTPTSASSGSIRLSNMDYYLHEANDELPEWFVKNKWHQLIYVAYSADYVPGGANDCVSSGNCLTLQVQRPVIAPYNDRQALVIAAGRQLPGQDRSAAGMVNYFENENAVNDLVFEKRDITDTFNDQISVIAP